MEVLDKLINALLIITNITHLINHLELNFKTYSLEVFPFLFSKKQNFESQNILKFSLALLWKQDYYFYVLVG